MLLKGDSSSIVVAKFEKWEWSNQLLLMIVKYLSDTVCGSVPVNGNAKDFLEAIRGKFKKSDKAKIANLKSSFMNTKHDNMSGV